MLKIYRKSIQGIPRNSGFIWVKAKNKKSRTITIWASHSNNVYEAVRLKDRREWLHNDLTDFWIEILLDEDILLST